jgi:p24 family protein beta-1
LGSSTEKNAEKLDPVQAEIKDLNSGLRSVRDEQDFLRQREEYHDRTAKSTNKRVIVWFLFQFIFLGTVGYVQIYFLKRFFETRRIV